MARKVLRHRHVMGTLAARTFTELITRWYDEPARLIHICSLIHRALASCLCRCAGTKLPDRRRSRRVGRALSLLIFFRQRAEMANNDGYYSLSAASSICQDIKIVSCSLPSLPGRGGTVLGKAKCALACFRQEERHSFRRSYGHRPSCFSQSLPGSRGTYLFEVRCAFRPLLLEETAIVSPTILRSKLLRLLSPSLSVEGRSSSNVIVAAVKVKTATTRLKHISLSLSHSFIYFTGYSICYDA